MHIPLESSTYYPAFYTVKIALLKPYFKACVPSREAVCIIFMMVFGMTRWDANQRPIEWEADISVILVSCNAFCLNVPSSAFLFMLFDLKLCKCETEIFYLRRSIHTNCICVDYLTDQILYFFILSCGITYQFNVLLFIIHEYFQLYFMVNKATNLSSYIAHLSSGNTFLHLKKYIDVKYTIWQEWMIVCLYMFQ